MSRLVMRPEMKNKANEDICQTQTALSSIENKWWKLAYSSPFNLISYISILTINRLDSTLRECHVKLTTRKLPLLSYYNLIDFLKLS